MGAVVGLLFGLFVVVFLAVVVYSCINCRVEVLDGSIALSAGGSHCHFGYAMGTVAIIRKPTGLEANLHRETNERQLPQATLQAESHSERSAGGHPRKDAIL